MDYVLSHTCSNLIMDNCRYYKEKNHLNTFFDMLGEELKFKHWYFGHFHMNAKINENYSVLYDHVIKLE